VISDGDGQISLRYRLGAEAMAVPGVGEQGGGGDQGQVGRAG
jgi:hypothetical protein